MEAMNSQPQTTESFAKAVRAALAALKARRPVFHSEGDFQHEFASALTDEGLSRVRVEWPSKVNGDSESGKSKWVDIVADGVAIELKHKPGEYVLALEGEKFLSPRDTDANVVDRREFWEDVWRVDQLVNSPNHEFVCGFAILLTNREKFWKRTLRGSAPFAYDGYETKGFFNKGHGQHRKLSRACTVHWEDWSDLETQSGSGVFRCAVVEVKPPHPAN